MVNEGGYRHTVEDGVSGRLLPRDDWTAWHQALEEAADSKHRQAWAKAGQENIVKLGLGPENQADDLLGIITKLRN